MSELVHSFHWEYSYESATSLDYVPPHRRILCTEEPVAEKGRPPFMYTDVPEDFTCTDCIELFALAALRSLP